MKLKTENGMVTFIMKVGKDRVISKMTLNDATNIIANAKDIVETDLEMIVDDKYFFPAEPEKKPRKKKVDEVSEDE